MIEVLLVMIIIGILAAIAIPMYLGQRERAKNAAARVGGRTIAVALLSCVTESDADDPWPAQCDQATSGRLPSCDRVAEEPVHRPADESGRRAVGRRLHL